MNTQQAYNLWAEQYDSNHNKTRDMEAIAMRQLLADITFKSCLEIGCGTGKNTTWFVEQAEKVTSVDLSEEMLAKARAKINSPKVTFIQADITEHWAFADQKFDLITFSLVLEHIGNLDHVFKQASAAINKGGYIYIGELHPFKQYTGSKARFETEQGINIVQCFNHHVSDFTELPKNYGLYLVAVSEHFDDDDRSSIPRILTVLLKKEVS